MISLTNHDFQWGRSEVVIIYPYIYILYIYRFRKMGVALVIIHFCWDVPLQTIQHHPAIGVCPFMETPICTSCTHYVWNPYWCCDDHAPKKSRFHHGIYTMWKYGKWENTMNNWYRIFIQTHSECTFINTGICTIIKLSLKQNKRDTLW